MAVVGAMGAWAFSYYRPGFASGVADAVGLHGYPNTAAGVAFGAAFTALFALGHALATTPEGRTAR